MASPQSCPGLSDDIPRERPSCFAPLSPPSGPVLVDESVASGQRSTADWTTLDPRWMMKLQINSRYESQVIATRLKSSWGPICCKPSKLLTVTGCRKYDSMTCRSIQRFCGAARQQAFAPSSPIWLSYKLIATDEFIFSASAKAWRQQQIKAGILFVVLPSKPDHWNPSNNWHSSEKCRISLQTWKNNPEIHIFIQHLHICWQLNSINLSLSQDGWKVTSWDTAAFNDSTETNAHQALAPSAPIWLFHKAMFVTHLLILSASAKAWRQQQIKVGVLFVVLPSKPDHWNPSNNWHSSEKWRISLIQTWKSNPEIHIFIQHLHTVWHTAGLGVFDNSTRSEMNDETTAPANHPNFSL